MRPPSRFLHWYGAVVLCRRAQNLLAMARYDLECHLGSAANGAETSRAGAAIRHKESRGINRKATTYWSVGSITVLPLFANPVDVTKDEQQRTTVSQPSWNDMKLINQSEVNPGPDLTLSTTAIIGNTAVRCTPWDRDISGRRVVHRTWKYLVRQVACIKDCTSSIAPVLQEVVYRRIRSVTLAWNQVKIYRRPVFARERRDCSRPLQYDENTASYASRDKM